MTGVARVSMSIVTPAQTGAPRRQSPIQAIVRQNAENGAGPLERKEVPIGLVTAILGIAVAMIGLAWWVNRATKKRPPAEVRAFDRMAKKLKLGRPGRVLIEEIAQATGQSPLSLLTSPGALEDALRHPDRVAWRRKAAWKKVAALAAA